MTSATAAPVRAITQAAEVPAVLTACAMAGVVGIDTETTGLDPLTDRLRLVQLATPGRTYVIDCFRVPPAALADLAGSVRQWVGHNLKFDLKFLLAACVPLPESDAYFDTMLAHQLLYAGRVEGRLKGSGLAAVVALELGEILDKREQVSDWSGALSDAQIEYAARDAAVLLPLHARQRERIEREGLAFAADIEMGATPMVAWSEWAGIGFDRAAWMALAEDAAARQAPLRAALDRETGALDMFGMGYGNWDSPKFILEQFGRRGVTLSGTDELTLREIADREPLAATLLEYREYAKLTSTYGLAWLDHVHPATGRIHADVIQIGAASGRMTYHRPNLQQNPRIIGYRRCYVAPPGRALVKADYSQIELRMAAQIASEERMIAAYRAGEDLHALTAATIAGKTIADVTKQDRQLAKPFNFGLLYGMGADKLVAYALKDYGVRLDPARGAGQRDAWFALYPGIRRWHRSMSDDVTATRTQSGRRRVDVYQFSEKLATTVSGSCADLFKLALGRLWDDRAAWPSAVPVLFVHDEIVMECDTADAPGVAAWLSGHMVAAARELMPDVPAEAEATICQTWGGD